MTHYNKIILSSVDSYSSIKYPLVNIMEFQRKPIHQSGTLAGISTFKHFQVQIPVQVNFHFVYTLTLSTKWDL